jgi:hypothetical protein
VVKTSEPFTSSNPLLKPVYWTVSKVHFRLLALALAGVRLEKRSEVSVLF